MSTTQKNRKRGKSVVADQALLARRADRALRAEQDPWFGKRRPAGEMGRSKSKAARNKAACRGRGDW